MYESSETAAGNIFFSNLDENNESVIVGIDEAGRGPVLGYMVYSALVLPARMPKSLGFKDSKALTSSQRHMMFEAIKREGFGYVYHCNHPNYISEMMLSKSMTLNEISVASVLRLLGEVGKKCSAVDTVYIDALGNCDKYKSRLEKVFPYRFVITEKADSKFQVVSGASIVAKVNRDALMADFGEGLGSGYTSDPNTIAWLRQNTNKVFGFPCGVRYSWITIKKMLGERRSKPLKGMLSGFYLSHT